MSSVPGTGPAATTVTTVRSRWTQYATVALRIALLVAASWALRRELVGIAPRELTARLAGYGLRHVLIGLACTAGSFLVLGVIEVIALRHASPPDTTEDSAVIRRGAAMTTAFVANALSQSIGLALLTGAAVRARAYARRGLGTVSVARITAFVTLTTTLGLLATSAAALLTSSAPLHLRGLSIPVQPVGALLALLVIAYPVWGALGRSAALGSGRWRLTRPSPGMAIAQVGLSALDWLLAGTVLFAFVPTGAGIGYWALMRAYLIAQTVGMTSHVPGGAGVLELVLLALVAGTAPPTERAAIVASLVMFRVVYYLVPLIVAMAVAGVAEVRRSVRGPRAFEAAHVA